MKGVWFLVVLCVVPWMSLSQLAMAARPLEASSSFEQLLKHGKPLYVRMADTALDIFNSTGPGKEQWNYERGTLLYGIESVWRKTNVDKYYEFIVNRTDAFVAENGSIPTFKIEDYNLDNIRSGTNLLFLYGKTGLQKYKIAADLLHEQLKGQPRLKEGGYWHKLIYPYQMWLDGLFMAEPFRAQYAKMFDKPEEYDDIALQHIWMEKNARDEKTGLLYHGYDESREQAWANKVTGTSPSFWGRAMGWYAMSLVDTLDYFPKDHPKRDDLIHILRRLAKALTDFQDKDSGVWWQVVDQGGRAGNYFESSASSCFVYALAKGAHKGYLAPHYYLAAKFGYEGIKKQFVVDRADGGIDLTNTVSVGGLGGTSNYRNGTYEYYLSEKVVTNDAKGIGPFLLASVQLSH
ncbi:unsaturated rhamnogalacturonyl hydrolase [Marchantia polymorpha subsp. ruderalis]|uniref:Glycosyl hydrolase family 88 n=2 Tax=Marchantia polymorpha TaxID=3197 RepID=A0AAF6B2I5_MARPO|nr:hypothetical protein MARPO_0049s0102 [Marchantia polymorpha]BBN06219.1 hypothetical protein Mp_3g19320 [Marchantia polymorpha subsp. ruderalis]|eukprot:PTQ38824.1 hypothetical protein MARPO_0049s0102 [Marchantia polymorpha]